MAGQRTCRMHGGATKAARAKAHERILMASGLAAKQLIEFMTDKKVPHAVRLRAAQDLLDRANLSGTAKVKVETKFELRLDAIVRHSGERRALPAPDGDSQDDVLDAEVLEDDAPVNVVQMPANSPERLTQRIANDTRLLRHDQLGGPDDVRPASKRRRNTPTVWGK